MATKLTIACSPVVKYAFIKFQCPEKIKKLQHGLVYMKNLTYYRELEKNTGDNVSGDLFEALVYINEGLLLVPELNLAENLKGKFFPTNYSNDLVFCMFGIDTTKPFHFTDEQKEKLRKFGDSALVITDSDEFLKRISKAADNKKYRGIQGTINYFDPNKDSLNLLISLINGMEKIAFSKREIYRYQQEYRFLIRNELNLDHIELDVGDISDISMILDTPTILNSMLLKQ